MSEASFWPFGFIKGRVRKQYLLYVVSDEVLAGVAVLVSY